MEYIDLRSDTVTLPTQEMRDAMYKALVGDDVYGEDPTVKELEEMAADIMGKEDAMFVTSGTQGNQVSVMTHTHHGDEIILEEKCHIITYEVGGIGYLSGVQAKTISGINGIMDPKDVLSSIRTDDIHFPKTSLICLENTHNRAGGTVIPLSNMKEIYEIAKAHNIPVHLDGARIFNAATYLNVDVKEISRYADSVMFCLSKGLCAPVGSIVAGSKEFIKKARKYRKMLGGGLRQAGILAAAGIVALEKMTKRLAEDHENARLLAEGLNNIKGINVDMSTVQTNIVMSDISATGLTGAQLSSKLLDYGIKVNGGNDYTVRFVTHYYIKKDHIDKVLHAISAILKEQ
ncbi:low-specificity L-threonine aldolase [Thermoanaerobacterium sp. R66]|uniref:low-specificity L-threonine aldolase n=1 Tax=Thermoanaerobacterium sp. R66 TaxID=2742479 RepID=UPI00237FDFCA|nr:low-specificity L-threonine aldolase [Thermoanaerobacterium sp. R66]MDE4543186.1 low-specificity L-threonine aldolase [Thermoanaerobacterium sp. R66]